MMIDTSRIEEGIVVEKTCSERLVSITDRMCGVDYWGARWLFNDWKSSFRYYMMIFFWLVLILGVSGLIGFYTEPMQAFWLPLSITLVAVSLLYLIWYFYMEWRLAPDLCCVC